VGYLFSKVAIVNKDLIINSSPEGVEIALLEEKKLVEIHNEKLDARWSVGDLYLGKVKKNYSRTECCLRRCGL